MQNPEKCQQMKTETDSKKTQNIKIHKFCRKISSSNPRLPFTSSGMLPITEESQCLCLISHYFRHLHTICLFLTVNPETAVMVYKH